ncbi:MAG: DivIVA domain-containing protein [Clostridia bacterium]|nr:DivIVA domain-containing protein [Clostridia bacterium]
MPLSEKFTDIKFTKSVAGYAQKEVDGFINDVLPLVKEQEQQLAALKAKIAAFEAERDEISAREHESYRLLEAAKKESDIIIATAKKRAVAIESEAQTASEVQHRASTARAGDIIASAEKKATALVNDAEINAKKIIQTADATARAMLEKVKEHCDSETAKAQRLSDECAAFEARFKAVVAETANTFAKLKEQTPLPAKAPEIKAKKEPTPAKNVREELPKVQPAAEVESDERENSPEEMHDIEIVGGKPVTLQQKKTQTPRRLYDTLQVTYDDDDDFSEISEIMKRSDKRKSPVDFSE